MEIICLYKEHWNGEGKIKDLIVMRFLVSG